MPGVEVITRAAAGPSSPEVAANTATFIVAGLAERGPTDHAVMVRSIGDFAERFGGRVSFGFLYDALEVFFAEGGAKAFVVRVVGDAAVKASITFQDSTPADSMSLTALGEDTFSNGLEAEVAAGTISGTFKIILTRASDGSVLEVYDNLTSVEDAVGVINLNSLYVEATDLGGDDPATVAAAPLAGGDDDRGSVVAQDYVDALDTHAVDDIGSGAVAIPGQDAAAVGTGLLDHAENTDRIALLATTATATPTEAITAAQALVDNGNGEYGGLFFPWVTIPAGNATKDISPEGFVAGVRARTHRLEGAWRPPAGEAGSAEFVLGTTQVIGRTVGDQLDGANVSAIRGISGNARLYGWRSLSADENYPLLTGREVLNYIASEGEARLEQFVFRSIDTRGGLFGELAAEMLGVVQPIALAGGLFPRFNDEGVQIDPGFKVDVGPSVNTPTSIQQGIAKVAVSVRVAPNAASIELLLTKVAVNAAL